MLIREVLSISGRDLRDSEVVVLLRDILSAATSRDVVDASVNIERIGYRLVRFATSGRKRALLRYSRKQRHAASGSSDVMIAGAATAGSRFVRTDV